MEQIQKGAQDSLDRYNKRTEILEDILRCRSQERKEDKTPQVLESYSETLNKLVSTKKAGLEGEGRRKEESSSQSEV